MMTMLNFSSKADAKGFLHLDIPVDAANEEYDVTVTVKAKNRLPFEVHPGYPSGFIEETYGSIDDETFVRPPQGELPKRLELE